MSDVIKLLPDFVANQIAAGEVIQRPASVVKELVENAIDAGASKIQVVIRDAGRTLIQIIDNGCGMSVTDARLAFERHSTSKIRQADDLFTLRTMGFRGEALASIAAVAQVEMKTMRAEDPVGTRLIINGSEVEIQEPVATVAGTNMMIKNLFFNVPARRKFLKKDAVEFNNILHEFERLALVNPSVELSLTHNDVVVHQLNSHTFKQRIGSLFGKNIEGKLIPVETETSIVTITGFIGLPQNARKRGALQYLFVNGRNMRHPYFHKAILHCYEQLIRPDEQPSYFIDFKVDPATIDVNIHPTKNEIKFENEQHIWQILVAGIKESLGRFNAVPSIDFDAVDTLPELPPFDPGANTTMPASGIDDGYNPFTQTGGASSRGAGKTHAQWRKETSATTQDWEKLYSHFINGETDTIPSKNDIDLNSGIDITDGAMSDLIESSQTVHPQSAFLQIRNKYILTQNRAGILVIDQHRAHVRVLFDDILQKIKGASLPSQQLIFPEVVELLPGESAVLSMISEYITKFGFSVSFLGDNAWAINGAPAIENIDNPVILLKEVINALLEEEADTEELIYEKIAVGIARSGAIRAGRSLSDAEMESLVSSLLSLPPPAYTPDGLKTFAQITEQNIEALF